MPKLRNIKCTIHTSQGELAEFEDKDPSNTRGEENTRTITRYLDISGTAGHRFWIRSEVQSGFGWERRFNCLLPTYMIDGIKLPSSGSCRQSKPKKYFHGPTFTRRVKGKNATFTSNMFFKELKVVEGSDGGTICSPDDPRIKELGRIEVKFRRCFSDRIYGSEATAVGQMHRSLETVDEKALKGRSTSHGLHLDGERPALPQCPTNRTYCDTAEAPYVKFIFLYHTHESLQKLGVIPQPRNPDIETQQTPEQLEQEIKRLASQLSQKKESLKRRLGEASGSDVESKDTIKKEGASSRTPTARKVKVAKMKIVDLTTEE